MKDFKEQIKKVTEDPGVYMMKDSLGNVIYIGKAKNIKKRLSSYFRGFDSHEPKTQTLVVNIDAFEYIITNSELEALILEATLIKQHMPRFNIRLKDDKAYPFIKVTINEKYPRVMKVRKVIKDKSKYFGPYTSNLDVNQTLEVIHSIFPVRKCSVDLTKQNKRPCLNYHIKKCLGPCMGDAYYLEYQEAIRQIIGFLSGRDDIWVKQLEDKMADYAAHLFFEQAAEVRNQLQSLKALTLKQTVVTDKDVDQDIIGYALKGSMVCVMVFNIRHGKLIGREHYLLETHQREIGELLSEFIVQYYAEAELLPKEVIVGIDLEDASVLHLWLSQLKKHKVYLLHAQKGDKKSLLDIANKNAWDYLEKNGSDALADNEKRATTLKTLQDILSLDNPLKRLEAYDISNIMGVYSVGSMVVYEDAVPKKNDYRRFKVRTIEGPNDVGSMQEILFRRFKRYADQPKEPSEMDSSFFKTPDLLLIDGGKGQVHAVADVLLALGLKIPVAGMVKNASHRTEALYYEGVLFPLSKSSDVYKLIYSIQEEVHRFAITYHKSLRDKGLTQSLLDEITGIGPQRKRMLLTHFKTIEAIQKATMEELVAVPSMNRLAAEKIKAHFGKGE
jgi:excinuclease ABC subunit C